MYGLNVINNISCYGGHFIETNGAYYFIPNNCSDSTNTIIFSHGAGGDAQNYMEFISNNNIDAIVAIPKYNLSYYNMNISNDMLCADIEKLHNQLGINNNNVFTVAHSAGGLSSVYFLTENIKRNPNIGPQTCVLFDPATQDAGNAGYINALSSEQLQLIGNNHSTFIAFEQKGLDVEAALVNYKKLGDVGANVIVFGMPNMNTYCPAGPNVADAAHIGILQYGFNRGILSYLAGDKPLDAIFETGENAPVIYKYDVTTKTFKQVTMADVAGYIDSVFGSFSNFTSSGEYHAMANFNDFSQRITNLKQLSSFPTISSDIDYVVTAMNTIRNMISTTSLINNTGNITCKSTTAVPTCASDFLYQYYSIVLELLEKLEKETEAVIEIANSIENTNTSLEKLTEEL